MFLCLSALCVCRSAATSMQAEQVPIPALLATGAVHHHLIRTGKHRHAGLLVAVRMLLGAVVPASTPAVLDAMAWSLCLFGQWFVASTRWRRSGRPVQRFSTTHSSTASNSALTAYTMRPSNCQTGMCCQSAAGLRADVDHARIDTIPVAAPCVHQVCAATPPLLLRPPRPSPPTTQPC